MTALELFINEKNRWNQIMSPNCDLLKYPTTDILEFDHLRNLLELELEPENLYMDGEASIQQVNSRRDFIKSAQTELEALREEFAA